MADTIAQLEDELKNIQDEADKYEQEYTNLLVKKKQILSQNTELISKHWQLYQEYVRLTAEKINKNHIQNQNQDGYEKPDLHIKLNNTLYEFYEGVPVEWKKMTAEQWLDINLKNALLVGLIGDFKTGKSFLLSKLSGLDKYEHSSTKSTIGLNFIFGRSKQGQKVYYIDSAGSGEPLQSMYKYAPTFTDGKPKLYWKLRKQHIDNQFGKPYVLHRYEVNEIEMQVELKNFPERRKQIEEQFNQKCIAEKCTLADIQQDKKINLTPPLGEEERNFFMKIQKSNEIDPFKEQCSLERFVCERFIQNFVMEESNVLIILVTRLSRQQEQLINQLYRMLQEPKNQHKKVIIVHNFFELYLKQDMEKQIQKDIVNSFNVEEIKEPFLVKSPGPGGNQGLPEYKEIECRYWTDKSISSHNPIVHVALGNDYTQDETVRECYNRFAAHVINRQIDAQTDFQQRNLFETVEDYFSENLEKSVRILYEEEAVKAHKEEYQKKLEEYRNKPQYKNRGNIEQKVIESQIAAVLRKKIPISRIQFEKTSNGDYLLKGKYLPKNKKNYRFLRLNQEGKANYQNEFAPRYNVTNQVKQVVVLFEAPGLSKSDIANLRINYRPDLTKQKHIITIKGKRSFESNELFSSISDEKLVIDENFKQSPMDFGEIDMEVEIADMEVQLNTQDIKCQYVASMPSNNAINGGYFCIIIPKLILKGEDLSEGLKLVLEQEAKI